MVPAGSVLAYQAKVVIGDFTTPADVIKMMNQVFSQSNIIMRDYHIAAGILSSILAPINGAWDFELTATLQTTTDFNAVQDITSIADHGIYMATGKLPASTIPSITVPGGAATPTGEPTQIGAGSGTQHKCGDTSWGFTDDPGQYIQCLFSEITGTVMLVVLTILGVVLILASRTKGISARGASFG